VRQRDKTAVERWIRNRIRLFGASVLGLRISTLMLNPSGLFVSAAYQENGFRDLTRSAKTPFVPGEWSRITALATKYSPYWRTRYESFEHQLTGGIAPERSTFGRMTIAELGLVPLQKSDQFGAIIRWRVAERQIARKSPELDPTSDEFNALVAREWERMMFRGENTAHGGDRTGALAFGRRNVVFGPFVMFTSSISKIYSVGVRAAFQAQRGERTAAMRSMVGFLGAVTWAALVREFLRELRGSVDDDEVITRRTANRVSIEMANYIPFVGQAIVAPIVQSLVGQPGPRYAASASEQVIGDVAQTGVQLGALLASAVSQELGPSGKTKFEEDILKTVDGVIDLITIWKGVPYGGPKDVARIIKNLTQNKPDLRAELLKLQENKNMTQENRRLLESIRLNDTERFRRAIRLITEKDDIPRVTEILAVINREYGYLSRYKVGQPKRAELSGLLLELVDEYLAEQVSLQRIAVELIRENTDLLRVRPR